MYKFTNRTNWGLSICATPFQQNKGLIMGINWGGGSLADNYKYNIQKTMPSFNEFRDLYKANEYKFLKRLEPFFKIYLDLDVSSGEFNYSNFCFFRTPDISSLRKKILKHLFQYLGI